MIGPEADHYVLVSHAKNFTWRDGHMGDLIPLLGDGLLTIDGEFHRRSRKAMLPAFPRERVAAPPPTMVGGSGAARGPLAAGGRVGLHAWTRPLGLRGAVGGVFGPRPH